MIKLTPSHHHWNYFFALDNDLEKVSRFIEFSEANLETYSIELTHILLSACSEIDVVLKQASEALCEIGNIAKKFDNMNNYREIFMESSYTHITSEPISIPRYGLTYCPWENWKENENPNWWYFHNKVKHERHVYYDKANVRNTVNAVGGLLLALAFYYQIKGQSKLNTIQSIENITYEIQGDKSTFVQLDSRHYKKTFLSIDEIETQLRRRAQGNSRVR